MKDDCLLELYTVLSEEARRVFNTLARNGSLTMERISLRAQMTNQEVRKGVWGLISTGLLAYKRGRPLALAENGERLVALLARQQ